MSNCVICNERTEEYSECVNCQQWFCLVHFEAHIGIPYELFKSFKMNESHVIAFIDKLRQEFENNSLLFQEIKNVMDEELIKGLMAYVMDSTTNLEMSTLLYPLVFQLGYMYAKHRVIWDTFLQDIEGL